MIEMSAVEAVMTAAATAETEVATCTVDPQWGTDTMDPLLTAVVDTLNTVWVDKVGQILVALEATGQNNDDAIILSSEYSDTQIGIYLLS